MTLGEYTAYNITSRDFSDGDFSRFGNAVRKGAVIGAMGLAALAPAKAMSIEDQIKADTRAATTIYQQAMTRHNDMYGTDDMTLNYTPSRKEYIEEILPEFKNTMNQARTAVPSFDKDIKEASTIKPNFKYSGVRELNAIQSGIEEDLNNRTKAAIQKGKEHRNLESMRKGTTISDKDSHNGNPDKNVGEKISEKAGEAWNWTKDTAKNVGDKVSEGASKAWGWMKGVGSKIADKISGSKDKEFSEGDFSKIGDFWKGKVAPNLRKISILGMIGLAGIGGGAAGAKVGGMNMFVPKAQRKAVSSMYKDANYLDADAANLRATAIKSGTSKDLDTATEYNKQADQLREAAKSTKDNATKTSRKAGAVTGTFAGLIAAVAGRRAVKQKKEEDARIADYMRNHPAGNAGTP